MKTKTLYIGRSDERLLKFRLELKNSYYHTFQLLALSSTQNLWQTHRLPPSFMQPFTLLDMRVLTKHWYMHDPTTDQHFDFLQYTVISSDDSQRKTLRRALHVLCDIHFEAFWLLSQPLPDFLCEVGMNEYLYAKTNSTINTKMVMMTPIKKKGRKGGIQAQANNSKAATVLTNKTNFFPNHSLIQLSQKECDLLCNNIGRNYLFPSRLTSSSLLL